MQKPRKLARSGSIGEASVGTPTEAVQKVPQANPDVAELNVPPAWDINLISHRLWVRASSKLPICRPRQLRLMSKPLWV